MPSRAAIKTAAIARYGFEDESGQRNSMRFVAGLRRDHDFLLRGDVFTEDVIDTWIWYKTANECEALRQRPHPYEFAMYYDV